MPPLESKSSTEKKIEVKKELQETNDLVNMLGYVLWKMLNHIIIFIAVRRRQTTSR